jgi:hypothetical protein
LSSSTFALGSVIEEEAEPTPAPLSLIKVFEMVTPELVMLIFAFIMMLCAERTGLIIPLIIANAYDTLINESISDEERM